MASSEIKRQRSSLSVDAHPIGIAPLGSALLHPNGISGAHSQRLRGLGAISQVDDPTIMTIIEHCDVRSLMSLSLTSLWCYAWASHPELWRRLSMLLALKYPHNGTLLHPINSGKEVQEDCFKPPIGGWKLVYRLLIQKQTNRYQSTNFNETNKPDQKDFNLNKTKHKQLSKPVLSSSFEIPVKVNGKVFSDFLFHTHLIATMEFPNKFLRVDNVERRDYTTYSIESFREEFEIPNLPVVFTNYNILKESSHGALKQDISLSTLKRRFPTAKIHASGYSLSLNEFVAYCATTSKNDDSPMYMFDKHVLHGDFKSLAEELNVPKYFEDDLFSLLYKLNDEGKEAHTLIDTHCAEQCRPDWRWLIAGSKRSGSSFHVDPNGTSAFNACLSGSKKWVLFPPQCCPPGVHPSSDGSEVHTPPTATEWFLNYYEESRKLPKHCQPIECVTRAHEVIFVPSGWWHCVLNLEEGVALTQNFVSPVTLPKAIRFLHQQPHNISGLDSQNARDKLLERFLFLLKKYRPELGVVAVETIEKLNTQSLLSSSSNQGMQELSSKLNVGGDLSEKEDKEITDKEPPVKKSKLNMFSNQLSSYKDSDKQKNSNSSFSFSFSFGGNGEPSG